MEMSPGALLVDLIIISSLGGMVGFGVATLTEVCIIAVAAAIFFLEDVALISKAIGVRVRVMVNVLATAIIGVTAVLTVDMLASADADMRPCRMATWESISALTLPEDALRFGSEAMSCWRTTRWKCRASQA